MENINSLFRIKKIEYDIIEKDIPNGDLTVGYKDEVESFKIMKDQSIASFDIKRTIKFDPEVLYILVVVIEIRVEFINDKVPSIEFLEENAKEIVERTSALASLSTLIANITSAQGNPPVMTPAHLDYMSQ